MNHKVVLFAVILLIDPESMLHHSLFTSFPSIFPLLVCDAAVFG